MINKKIFYLIALLTLKSMYINAQSNTQNYKKLKWDDFKGICQGCEEQIEAAYSTLSLEIVPYNRVGDTCKIHVYAYFFSEDSWVNQSLATGYLLNHEQRHFDLIEIAARLIRKSISDKKYSNYIEFWDDANSLIKKMNADFVRPMNDLYDKETNHSANMDQQKIWDEKIQIGLDSLSAYSDEFIVKLIPPKKK